MTSFALPGFIQDFPPGSPQDIELNLRWNINAESWIQQAMPAAPAFFYDPSTAPIPPGTSSALVEWFAFPGRLAQYFSANPPVSPPNPYNLNATQIYSLADTGFYTDSGGRTVSFQQIPGTLCPQANWQGELKPFGPYGPRGWLDEYCEWSVARDGNGNVMRVDLACENPEYWYTLWAVDPQRVQQLYQATLNSGAPVNRQVTVSLADLQLIGRDGRPVIDPQTGRPAYNPLNRWNSGPAAVRTGSPAGFTGGAMHLTSTPNTLQTELGLAGAATPQYQSGNSDVQKLICCGQYGQEYRNSDPHIGYSVNRIVGGQGNIDGKPRLVCLANPVGLYIQKPDLSGLSFGPNIVVGRTVPAGAKPSDIFQIVRGSLAPMDPVTGQPFPGDMLLHVAFQIPQSWLAMTPSLTLSDLLINGQIIQWGGQIASQMQIGLFARPLQTSATPPTVPCAGAPSAGAPLQCMYQALWYGYYPIQEPSPGGQPMSLASNTVIVPPWLPPTGTVVQLILTCNNPPPANPLVTILSLDGSGPDPGISATVTASAPVTYAVPGNSYPGNYTALAVNVKVAPGTAAGLRDIQIRGGGVLPAAVYVAGSN
jgi:hypothetical protein